MGAGGLHRIASPPPFSGLCCRPADPAKSYFPHPHLPLPAFVTRVAVWVLEAENLQDTGYNQTGSRKSFRDRTAPGGDPALPQLRHSRPLGNTLLRPWAPWPIRNWWWFLEPQVSEPGLAVPPLVCRKSGCGSNRHMGGRGRQNLSTVWIYIYIYICRRGGSHTFNLRTQKAETGGFLRVSRPDGLQSNFRVCARTRTSLCICTEYQIKFSPFLLPQINFLGVVPE